MGLQFSLLWILSTLINFSWSEQIVARSWAELADAGWYALDENTTILNRPSQWRESMIPLDNNVSGGSIWVAQSSGRFYTNYYFGKFNELCSLNNLAVKIKYFSENARITTTICLDNPGSQYCYSSEPSTLFWIWANYTLDVDRFQEGVPLHLALDIDPNSGFIVFDQIILEHDGVSCDTTHPECPTTSAPCPCCDMCASSEPKEVHHYHHYAKELCKFKT